MKAENLYWIWLSRRLGEANEDFVRLILKYEHPYEIFSADEADLARTPGVSARTVTSLSDKCLDEASEIMNFCAKTRAAIIPYSHEKYPNRLRLLKNPPVLLYVKGNLPDMDERVCTAMVGTRRMSAYGRECSYRIGYELGAAGAVVVSGMALGIDGTAACGAINGGGRTVAVLGSGVDVVYPREHTQLMEHIIANGAVISEYPPGTPPVGSHFPVRNRIISGLCQGTLIVEADAISGAMITARTAIEQGRQIFAIPGNLGEENTVGTNQLIHDGAIIVINTEDILDEYTYLYGKSIDTARLFHAREKYVYSDAVLDKMGVCARVTKGKLAEGTKSNEPSAPAAAFRYNKRAKRDTGGAGIGADSYIANSKPRAAMAVSASLPFEADGDNSQSALASLDEKQRKMFEAIPVDRAVPIDALAKMGFSIGEIMSAMTVLEIKGLISSLPGGLYVRR